ncbi:MAG: SpoIIE family protein phosphatase [Kiritimatiellales bacterium]|nr:SpoIIE family protein phosphatase [Pontiella sp.]NNJ69674.1 SpoIIE family protein phosphatase [Kiritimatiellales bacterium]
MSEISYSTRVLLKNLMENMADKIYLKDLQSRFILVNKSTAQTLGYASPEEAVGKCDFDHFHEEDARRKFADEQTIIKSGKSLVGLEERSTMGDGRVIWTSTSKMPLMDKAGQVVGTCGISRDITQFKEAEVQAERYAEEIRRINEGLEQDVLMAAELQKTFFPHSYPVFPEGARPEESAVQFHHHYHPSGTVSGDFCAVRRLSKTKCGVLQCDVMGHGVRAALGTALICAIIEELMHQEHNPGRFLDRLNQTLLPILRQEDIFLYATACYMVYDAKTGQVDFANAGHPTPLCIRGSEGKAEWLTDEPNPHGPALAIAEDASYQTMTAMLQPGDTALMFTDGLYEVESAAGEEFGEQRLLDTARRHCRLPLQEIVPALINDVRHFSATGEFDDDICLVGLKNQRFMNEEVGSC